jgi:hypothetical protein
MVCSNEQAIARLREHNPDCRLVFMLRNPVARAYSSYSWNSAGAARRNS